MPLRLVAHSTSSAWAPYTQRQICFFCRREAGKQNWRSTDAPDPSTRLVRSGRSWLGGDASHIRSASSATQLSSRMSSRVSTRSLS